MMPDSYIQSAGPISQGAQFYEHIKSSDINVEQEPTTLMWFLRPWGFTALMFHCDVFKAGPNQQSCWPYVGHQTGILRLWCPSLIHSSELYSLTPPHYTVVSLLFKTKWKTVFLKRNMFEWPWLLLLINLGSLKHLNDLGIVELVITLLIRALNVNITFWMWMFVSYLWLCCSFMLYFYYNLWSKYILTLMEECQEVSKPLECTTALKWTTFVQKYASFYWTAAQLVSCHTNPCSVYWSGYWLPSLAMEHSSLVLDPLVFTLEGKVMGSLGI